MGSSNGQNSSSQCVCVNWVTISEMPRIDRNIDKLRDRNAERLFRLHQHENDRSLLSVDRSLFSVYNSHVGAFDNLLNVSVCFRCGVCVSVSLFRLLCPFVSRVLFKKRPIDTQKRPINTQKRPINALSPHSLWISCSLVLTPRLPILLSSCLALFRCIYIPLSLCISVSQSLYLAISLSRNLSISQSLYISISPSL